MEKRRECISIKMSLICRMTVFSIISDDNKAAATKYVVANDLDGTGNGELQRVATGDEGSALDLLDAIRHLIMRLPEVETTELQDLTIQGIAYTVFVNIVAVVFFVLLIFFNERLIVKYRMAFMVITIVYTHDGFETYSIKVERMDQQGHVVDVCGVKKHAWGRCVVVDDKIGNLVEGLACGSEIIQSLGRGIVDGACEGDGGDHSVKQVV